MLRILQTHANVYYNLQRSDRSRHDADLQTKQRRDVTLISNFLSYYIDYLPWIVPSRVVSAQQ